MNGFNVDDAVYFLELNTYMESKHMCAKHVRQALERGGLDTTGHPVNAYDYTKWLPTNGWTELGVLRSQSAVDEFTKGGLKPGDIAVYKNPTKQMAPGHICMWTGHRWLSDFKQRGLNVYRQFPDAIHIYRYNNQIKHPFDYGAV